MHVATQFIGYMAGGLEFYEIIYENGTFYDQSVSTQITSQGWSGSVPVYVRIIVRATAKLGSTTTATGALTIEALPNGSAVDLYNYGYIAGKGGAGGDGGDGGGSGATPSDGPGQAGSNGGPAITNNMGFNFYNVGGAIGGGGGGGGGGAGGDCAQCYDDPGSGGGGGAGLQGGAGGVGGESRSSYFEGVDGGEVFGGCWGRIQKETASSEWAQGGLGGRGGHLGQDGEAGETTGGAETGGAGGSAGATFTTPGTVVIKQNTGNIFAAGNAPGPEPECWPASGGTEQGGLPVGGGGCLHPDTPIRLANGGQVRVSELRPGDQVESRLLPGLSDIDDLESILGWTDADISDISETTATVVDNPGLAYDHHFSINSGLIRATPEHPVLVKRNLVWRFVPAALIIAGDYLYRADASEVLVTSVVKVEEETTYYNPNVEETDVYFANNMLLHNTAPSYAYNGFNLLKQ